MKSAFDANVPRRKPRTRLGSMLADIDEAPQQEQPAESPAPAEAEEAKVKAPAPKVSAKATPAKTPKTATKPRAKAAKVAPKKVPATPEQAEAEAPTPTAQPAEAAAADEEPPQAEAKGVAREAEPTPVAVPAVADAAESKSAKQPAVRRAPPAPASETRPAPGADVVRAGRDRLDALRQRLAVAERSRQPTIEPALTADRVRETVAQLRTRLDEVVAERKSLLTSLDEVRQVLSQTQAELERERAEKLAADGLASERGRVAEALMAEGEALADERDQGLMRIAELKLLDEEQAGLLNEMEAALAARTEELSETQRDREGMRQALEAVQTDLALTEGQLDEEREARLRLTRQVEDLTAQLSRAESAKSALSEIQRLVDGV